METPNGKDVSAELLNILCCPACKGDLEYEKTQQTLTCKGCKRIYPIKNGIPVMLVDHATH